VIDAAYDVGSRKKLAARTKSLRASPGGDPHHARACRDRADSDPQTIGVGRAPSWILGPRDGQTFAWPGPMRLWAFATDDAGEQVPEGACRWSIDGRAAATGTDVFVDAPKPGKHRATLGVRGRGGRVEQSIAFTTVEVGEDRDED
jgi:hypothetical protein